jgi:GDPmannose 4,6-dehydratase
MAGVRGRRDRHRRFNRETLVQIDPHYLRPTEVDLLLGDPSKAGRVLGWHHRTTFPELVAEMVDSDIAVMSVHSPRAEND